MDRARNRVCRHTHVDASRMNSALFELVDIWTSGTEAEEYLSFLEALRFKLRYME